MIHYVALVFLYFLAHEIGHYIFYAQAMKKPPSVVFRKWMLGFSVGSNEELGELTYNQFVLHNLAGLAAGFIVAPLLWFATLEKIFFDFGVFISLLLSAQDLIVIAWFMVRHGRPSGDLVSSLIDS